jgi:O-antigen ligase/polysaccharide polymerase Wzy-like membrane protein
MVGTWTSRVRPRTTIYLLALIGTLQGVICIAQYYQVYAAWELPNTLMQAVGARYDITLIPQVHFVDVQRVRGTTLLVHKFNPMQGMLTAFLLAVVVLNVQVKNVLKLQPLLLLAATLFTFIGMFLTFSRSTILGVTLTIVILLLHTRRFVTIAIIGSSIGLGYLIFQVLQLDDAAQFGRMTDFSETASTNASRIEQYPYAFQILANHPLIGDPRGDSAERILLHSVLLRFLVDYGMLGVIAYLLVVFGVVRVLWTGRKHDDDCAQVLGLASLCSFLIALLDSWTHSSGFLVRDVNQAGMVGLFIGLLMPHPLVATRRLVWCCAAATGATAFLGVYDLQQDMSPCSSRNQRGTGCANFRATR